MSGALAVALSYTAVLHADEENLKWAWNLVVSTVDFDQLDLACKDPNLKKSVQFKIDSNCKVTEKSAPVPLTRLEAGDVISIGYVSETDGTNLAKWIRYPFDPAADK